MGAAICTNGNKIVQDTHVPKTKLNNAAAFKEIAEDDINDKDEYTFTKSDAARPYAKLWQAVEANDLPAAEKYLDWNDVTEANLYDPFG
jgi:hypothetical protein